MTSYDYGTSGIIKFPVNKDNLADWEISQGDTVTSDVNAVNLVSMDIPFAPYPRTDRLGRIADWTGPVDGVGGSSGGPGGAGGRRSYYKSTRPDEEEAGWSFTAEKAMGGAGKQRGGALKPSVAPVRADGSGGAGRGHRYGGGAGGGRMGMGGRRNAGWGGRFADRQAQRKREPSVLVSSEWRILEEIEFSRLTKLQLDPEDAEVVKTVGSAWLYDRQVADRISTKAEKVINLADHHVEAPSTSFAFLEEDQTLLKLAKEKGANIICSDATAAALMVAPRSVIPWDIVISKRADGLIVIDQRAESNVGAVTVSENAADSPADEILSSLSLEASILRDCLPKQLAKELESFSNAPATTPALRYTRLDLGEGNVLMVRTAVRSVVRTPEGVQPMPITPLLEQGEKSGIAAMDWRTKLDSQRGAVLAHEIRNNGAQLARALFSAILSASPLMKLAYVTRSLSTASATSKRRLSLLGLQEYEPYELASQMNLNIPNGFGVLRAIIDLVRKQSSGDYLAMRDPNKALLRLYKMSVDENTAVETVIDELIPATAQLYISIGESDDE